MRSSLVQGPHRAGKLNILYEEKANVVIFIGASCVCGASYAVPNVIDFSRYDTKCSGETRYCTSPCKFIKTLTKLRIILTSLINVNYKKKIEKWSESKTSVTRLDRNFISNESSGNGSVGLWANHTHTREPMQKTTFDFPSKRIFTLQYSI